MISLFKKLELPHVSIYKNRWLRRLMIIVMMPQEVARATYHLCGEAKVWWNWDGVEPIGPPPAN